MNLVELYGFLDPVTRKESSSFDCKTRMCFKGEWTDGIISMLYRMINRPTTRNERRYIVFDGDVDPLWMENLVKKHLKAMFRKCEELFIVD